MATSHTSHARDQFPNYGEPVIETKRLILRQWKESDKTPNFHMNSNPEVMKFFPKPLSREESDLLADRMKAKIDQNGFGFYAVEEKESGLFVGTIGLNCPEYTTHFTPCTEIGWRLDNKFWKRGYATEGAKAVLNYAFDELKLDEIVSFTSKLNTPSMSVMERIGMHRVEGGDFEHPNVEKGHPLSWHVLYLVKQKY